jgi:enoyl-[acyl-carrier protein] reductase II
MLRTPLCRLLGIEHPIIQAAIAPFTSPELVAAVSNAGGLGSYGTALLPLARVREDLDRTRELTNHPFAINFTLETMDDEVFALALEARPKVISFALGDPGDRVQQAHEAGCLVIQQVHTVRQAREAIARGVDALIAQGTEAGGFTGTVSAMALIPQIVDVAGDLPVIAAGGIADGRGLAAALVLGAQGVNIGTRFLASVEAACGDTWKQMIVAAESEDAVRLNRWFEIFPRTGDQSFDIAPRSLHTEFVQRWHAHPEEARSNAQQMQAEIIGGLRAGRLHEYVPFTGQTAGMIKDVLPAAEIVRRLVEEAEAALGKVHTAPARA